MNKAKNDKFIELIYRRCCTVLYSITVKDKGLVAMKNDYLSF